MSPYDSSASRPPRGKGERPGSKSPKHRGFRPEAEGAPVKKRWDADGRAARAEGRPARAEGGRPNWEPRKTGGSNPRFGGGARDDRDARNGARGGDRPSYDRDSRPSRGDDRPSYNRGGDRPAYNRGGDRFDRTDRFGGGRPSRDDRE